MLIRKNIWDLSNCQKPIKCKVTIAGSLPESCSMVWAMSYWDWDSTLITPCFPYAGSLSWLLTGGWPKVIYWVWWSDLTQQAYVGTNICLSFLQLAVHCPWKDEPVILCLCTYGPNGNFSMAELEVQAVCPSYCMSKLDIILFLSSPIQASPQWYEIFQSKIDVCVSKAILLSKYIVWPHIFIVYNKCCWLSLLIQ